ncbi:MAG: antitoxin VapB family protein [Nanoarchaeota archaeon]
MAKTIMVANEVYKKLKKAKGNNSFSRLLNELIYSKKEKTLGGLKEFVGVLKDDEEYDKIMKDLKKRWAEWTRKYA